MAISNLRCTFWVQGYQFQELAGGWEVRRKKLEKEMAKVEKRVDREGKGIERKEKKLQGALEKNQKSAEKRRREEEHKERAEKKKCVLFGLAHPEKLSYSSLGRVMAYQKA